MGLTCFIFRFLRRPQIADELDTTAKELSVWSMRVLWEPNDPTCLHTLSETSLGWYEDVPDCRSLGA